MARAVWSNRNRFRAGVGLGLLWLAPAWAWATSEEELFWKSIDQVNEGQLRFLEQAPDKPVHHLHNHIRIRPDSLKTGWVKLEQCHEHLDAFPRSQIVYNADRIRRLAITRHQGIGQAWVEGPSIQLRETGKGASICIRAETRALEIVRADRFTLHNGPYMRRFLDGFYPMRVSLQVRLDAKDLRYAGSQPAPQTGFRVWQEPGQVRYEALFEGILNTALQFERVPEP
ncbi:hypothetical protein EDC61_11339 [Sulfuritortus calidifontis]|uniref:Uncharacterized protein n=1 Tax=Sulfuritortus calidifontis TaxID=1914471 RepID=A0A4R3JTP6_9PROT|nr:hypothetical protein [Sulfuritortus calidifontis]TCS70886.1 hypothetical protein EDC61_11339 [Sulfuritortus calidifontis]